MKQYSKYLIIAALSSLLFFPLLGGMHLFDWDEINFAECAREMIATGDYLRPQIDFMPFWEKPPFFIWLQVLAMKIFGIGEYGARFPNALVGVITLLSIFHIGKKLVSEKMAIWWVAIYTASWLPHLYFKSGIIDPVFNLFIFLAFYQVYVMRAGTGKWMHALGAGLLLGMAAITKGPVAILVALLSFVVYIIINKGLNGYKLKHFLLIGVCALLPALLWIAVTAGIHGQVYGKWFLNEFIQYQVRLFSTEDSDHGGPFIYHFVVLLAGCFPASVFLFQYGRKDEAANRPAADFTRWMWILFWVVLILFSVVKTKIVHYSSLCYFPLTYLAALQLYRLSDEGVKMKSIVRALLLIIGSLLAIVILLVPVVGVNKDKLIPFIADPFAVANMRAAVSWSYAECIWGALYLAGIWYAVWQMKRNFGKGIMILAVLQIAIIQYAILFITPKVEVYSQRAAITYFKSFQGKDVYVQPMGYKSYANLFYTRKSPTDAKEYLRLRRDDKGRETPEANTDWLLFGQTDRQVYIICKVMDSVKFSNMPELKLTGSKNGFVFFKKIGK